MHGYCILRGSEQTPEYLHASIRGTSTVRHPDEPIRMPVPIRGTASCAVLVHLCCWILPQTLQTNQCHKNLVSAMFIRAANRYSRLPSSSARSRHFRHHSRTSGGYLLACLLATSLHATSHILPVTSNLFPRPSSACRRILSATSPCTSAIAVSWELAWKTRSSQTSLKKCNF